MRTVIGITGASGAKVAVEFIKRCPGEKYLIVSKWGRSVLSQETGLSLSDLTPYVKRIYSNEDMNSPLASGSVSFDQYAIVPCSLTTLARISSGLSENLIARVAEVALKEKRTLLLGVRETPFSAIALENALKLSRLGAIVMPLSPPFYLTANSADQMVTRFVDHLLTTLKLPSVPGWREETLKRN
jgi:4-hydroxy-3-polyprenylbenzoate decarboxylase